jgi:hypothetical protein
MRQFRSSGSVRGAARKGRPYRDHQKKALFLPRIQFLASVNILSGRDCAGTESCTKGKTLIFYTRMVYHGLKLKPLKKQAAESATQE